jgi:hypothetical protein
MTAGPRARYQEILPTIFGTQNASNNRIDFYGREGDAILRVGLLGNRLSARKVYSMADLRSSGFATNLASENPRGRE